MRGWKKIFHANGNDKEVRVTILMSDKLDFDFANWLGSADDNDKLVYHWE